jgi:hypothetical protein
MEVGCTVRILDPTTAPRPNAGPVRRRRRHRRRRMSEPRRRRCMLI